MTKSDLRKASNSYNKEEVKDEFSSPEGENKNPNKRTYYSSKTKKSYSSKSSGYRKGRPSINARAKRTEVAPSTAPPKLNGQQAKKSWIKKMVVLN